jgi:hypothetical protein
MNLNPPFILDPAYLNPKIYLIKRIENYSSLVRPKKVGDNKCRI